MFTVYLLSLQNVCDYDSVSILSFHLPINPDHQKTGTSHCMRGKRIHSKHLSILGEVLLIVVTHLLYLEYFGIGKQLLSAEGVYFQ